MCGWMGDVYEVGGWVYSIIVWVYMNAILKTDICLNFQLASQA